MRKFKLQIWPHKLELLGSVADEDEAYFSTLRVNANEYENGDEQMIRKAFDFATSLLQSTFSNVQVAESSASLEYEAPMVKEPPQVITANRIHDFLKTLGYRRKA